MRLFEAVRMTSNNPTWSKFTDALSARRCVSLAKHRSGMLPSRLRHSSDLGGLFNRLTDSSTKSKTKGYRSTRNG